MCILPLKRLPGVSRATVEVVYRFPRKRRVYPKNIASQSVQFCPPGVFGKVRDILIVTVGSVCGILASRMPEARDSLNLLQSTGQILTAKEDPASNINHQNPTVEYVGSPCLVLSHCPNASALGQLCTISRIRISHCILCLY